MSDLGWYPSPISITISDLEDVIRRHSRINPCAVLCVTLCTVLNNLSMV